MSATPNIDTTALGRIQRGFANVGVNSKSYEDEYRQGLPKTDTTQNQSEGTGTPSSVDPEAFASYVMDVYGVEQFAPTEEGQKPPGGLYYTVENGEYKLWNGGEELASGTSLSEIVSGENGLLALFEDNISLQDQALKRLGFSQTEIDSMRHWIKGQGHSDFQAILEYVFLEVDGFSGQALAPKSKDNILDTVLINSLAEEGIDVSQDQIDQWTEFGTHDDIHVLLVERGVNPSILDDWTIASLPLSELIEISSWYLEAATTATGSPVTRMNEEDQGKFEYFVYVIKTLEDDTQGEDGLTTFERFAQNFGINLNEYDLTTQNGKKALADVVNLNVYELSEAAYDASTSSGDAAKDVLYQGLYTTQSTDLAGGATSVSVPLSFDDDVVALAAPNNESGSDPFVGRSTSDDDSSPFNRFSTMERNNNYNRESYIDMLVSDALRVGESAN